MYKYQLLLLTISLPMYLPLKAQLPKRFDLVITELFADPSPSVGLPASEFIELKNISPVAIAMRNWKISDGNSTAVINFNYLLQPDSFLIICPTTAVNFFSVFGTTVGVSGFPSLNNEADIISLYSPEGLIMHAVGYTDAWYRNDLKAVGGWTLEMIDPKNPCGGSSNWGASINNKGGTPGANNSIDGINRDDQPPAFIRSYTIDSVTIVAVFDESLDSTQAANSSNYHLNNALGSIQSASPLPPLFTEVQLRLNYILKAETVYLLTINDVNDCAGNTIGVMNSAKAGLPLTAGLRDIILNELLFNPKTDGYDYVEFYNRSNKIIDFKQLYTANKNTTSAFTNIHQIIPASFLCFPGEFIVITENIKWLQQNYAVKVPGQLIQMNQLPSLPDDKGNIVVMNFQGKVVDELSYEQNWHFPLIDNKEGVALERINYDEPTQEKTNWTSAASTAGFGTPTIQNSQFRADLQLQAQISVYPKIFSPDNDGIDDFATIHCTLTQPGYVATISIFDVAGRVVKSLVRNATLSSTGIFRWDGLNDQQQRLPTGMYIILTEIFNLQGKTKKFKNIVTLGRR